MEVEIHFKLQNHDFNTNVHFTLIEELENLNTDTDSETFCFKEHEDLWMLKLKRLQPDELNSRTELPAFLIKP